MTPARLVTLLACALVAAGTARAQDSQFGIVGLGTPGRWESGRARTGAGAFAAFDPASTVTETALAEIGSLSASVAEGATFRHLEGPGLSSWLRSTRYPLFAVGGPVSSGVFVGGGYTTYLDRSFEAVTRDSVVLRDAMEHFTDAIKSDGGVSDLRLAAAARLGSRVTLGVGLHLLAGSTRMTATRNFDDSTVYFTVQQAGTVRYAGLGVSGSVLLAVTPTVSLAGFARRDGHLSAYVADTLVTRSDLPATVGGALRWTPVANARLAGSVMWRSWSRTGPNAFDTFNWTAGLELGRAAPVRVGVRGGQLPFGATGSAPTEWGVAAGTGRVLANGRGFLDIGVERLARDGSGLRERLWTIVLGLTLRP